VRYRPRGLYPAIGNSVRVSTVYDTAKSNISIRKVRGVRICTVNLSHVMNGTVSYDLGMSAFSFRTSLMLCIALCFYRSRAIVGYDNKLTFRASS